MSDSHQFRWIIVTFSCRSLITWRKWLTAGRHVAGSSCCAAASGFHGAADHPLSTSLMPASIDLMVRCRTIRTASRDHINRIDTLIDAPNEHLARDEIPTQAPGGAKRKLAKNADVYKRQHLWFWFGWNAYGSNTLFASWRCLYR